MADKPFKFKEFSFTGRLITAVDATTIDTNFQTLTNLRYTDTGIRGIGGMTKINTTAVTGTDINNGFHFKKPSLINVDSSGRAAETHVIISGNNKLYQNTTAIPSTGDFSGTALWTDSANAGKSRFSKAPLGQMSICNGIDTLIWGGNETTCSGFINYNGGGGTAFVRDYTNKIFNASEEDYALLIEDDNDTHGYMYVGFTRPIQGIKFYVKTGNDTNGVMTVNYWDGSAWQAVGSLSDGTIEFSESLAVTGLVSFDSTVATAKISQREGVILYWYQVKVTNMDSTTEVYHVTVDAPMQTFKDNWDGQFRTCLSAQFDNNSVSEWIDYTIALFEKDYNSDISTTYAFTSVQWTIGEYIYLGFQEPMQGLDVVLAEDRGSTSAATLAIKYWDGAAWQSVANLVDGTDSGGDSMAHSGLVTWTPVGTANAEFKTDVERSSQLYFYRLEPTSASYSANLRIDYIGGIPAPVEIGNYKFPVFGQNRVWLCNNTDAASNASIVSAVDTAEVFNGEDSWTFYFGEETALVAGAALYNQFGSSLYNMMVFCKDDETYAITGNSPEDWVQYEVSDTIGCTAPLTMKSINMETGDGVQAQALIWQAADGIYLFDGKSPILISQDISNLFDPLDAGVINQSYIGISTAFVDTMNQEYHWCFAATGSATINKEYVYDLKRKKWYEINRGTAKQLVAGIEVSDTSDKLYVYGCLGGGFLERLENGTDFDSVDIDHTVHFGDVILGKGGLWELTEVRKIKLVTKAKSTTPNTITGTHYADTLTAGTTFDMPPVNALGRTASIVRGGSFGQSTFHSIKLQMTTDDEVVGFEPLLLGVQYKERGTDLN